MKARFLVLALLSACMPYQGALPPPQWAPAFRQMFEVAEGDRQCFWTRDMVSRGVSLTSADRAYLTAEMQQSGLSSRDIAFAFDPGRGLETGLSYRAVKCIGGGLINDAFYPGVGHQWQMRLGNNYVYLEGDGTMAGMRVTAWN